MTWKEELRNNITSVEELEEVIGKQLKEKERKSLDAIIRQYPMSIPKYYLGLIDFENLETDPIGKLALPSLYEESRAGSFDTSGEGFNTVAQGLQHKYRETGLMLSTSSCAMYCRFCFRKRLVGEETDEVTQDWKELLEYIENHTEINNILVSGGDSFILSDQKIKYLLDRASQMDHLDFIRFGTRIPVVFPQRILDSPDLLEILEKANRKKQVYIITHYNHPREFTKESLRAIELLKKTGVVIRNQTVLLKGVNDDSSVLQELFSGLTKMGVQPYYLFQCRPVTGVKNQFQVPLIEGVEIVDRAKDHLNGLAKSFRYAMSHVTGKIEILGQIDEDMIFKYAQAKDLKNSGRLFKRKIGEKDAWLPEIEDL